MSSRIYEAPLGFPLKFVGPSLILFLSCFVFCLDILGTVDPKSFYLYRSYPLCGDHSHSLVVMHAITFAYVLHSLFLVPFSVESFESIN
jgi:hypothetical protein